ncbi:PAS domain S-box protein [Chitinophaga sp. GCM10012297]|uniref:histidine kinase n=1 Tax=Chitinophaga chungangae TaxID=2821488 RepID=A0ABS3YCA9_9BACT|nr:PAS domain S-box protein [Chitinophaga chungangae]MBO9152306.1 PAS domain S-box protein [Chitinophaga chungangae]
METGTNNHYRGRPAGGMTGYPEILQLLPAAVYSTDAAGFILRYNDAAAELWGVSPEAGKTLWSDLWKVFDHDGRPIPPEAAPMSIALREGNELRGVEVVLERADGLRKTVACFPRPVYDAHGRLTGTVNMLTDITKQNEAIALKITASLEKSVQEYNAELLRKNEALKKSEERYHKMIEEVEDYAILLLNREGYILNWNRGAEKIKGYREEEIVGRHFSIFYLPEDREQGLPARMINSAATAGKAMQEGWRMRKNGTRFWGSIIITALHNDAGDVIGFSKVTRDLTEKKIAEDKIRKYAAELEFQNKELEQFAYAAAHDMKEPLRKIQFYNSYVNEYADGLPEKMKDFLSRSMDAAKRMRQLIDDLLTYSKASSFSQELAMVDLNEVVNAVVASHRDSVERMGAVIEWEKLPVIKAIPFQFNQLFENLLGNSLKYRHPGRPPKIKVAASIVPGSELKDLKEVGGFFHKITVTDNGIGFDTQYAAKIFDLFQRLHNGNEYTGTGIGLAICKKIVQNHQGVIRASSLPYQGAEFAVYIPAGN